MPSQLKPIKLWGEIGPNPVKVALLLEELGVPYEIEPTMFHEVKQPAYLAINPNGRLPAIHDPNTNLTLWESGAIMLYLTERYDPNHTLSFPGGTPESEHARQWLFFQTTGQGPYYGQAVWFRRYSPEPAPMAARRYSEEVKRVTSVLETWLGGQPAGTDGPWLVGGKFSYADLSFVPWQAGISNVVSKEDFDADAFPLVKAWLGKMTTRMGVKKVMDASAAAKARETQ